MSAFYSAVSNSLATESPLRCLLCDAQSVRQLPPPYLANLLFRAIQYLKLFRWGEPEYLYFTAEAQWRTDIVRISMDKKRRDALHETLVTRDTQTTRIERYAGVRVALALASPTHRPLRVADLGCGANLGLRAICENLALPPIDDQTPDHIVSLLLSTPIRLSESLAIDRHDPYSPDMNEWLTACSFYPHELIENGRWTNPLPITPLDCEHVRFRSLDLLAPGAASAVPTDVFDAVVISTVLYQHNRRDRDRLVSIGSDAVRSGGVLIIQDFVHVEGGELRFVDRWFDGANYSTVIAGDVTGWKFAELLRWGDGRCARVYLGRDFQSVEASGVRRGKGRQKETRDG
ncbi:MAG: hypothetical protein M1482_14970 [Chloroflexi bacterium]|nr:hypothetical protein [Chloroflexota bacterium]